MAGTDKLFEKLKKENKCVEVNAELLSYFGDVSGLEEYQNLFDPMGDPTSRTENLKKLVFKLYEDHKLKDLDFFKYLAWSGQGELCKLVGYGDKQIEKLMKDKPSQSQTSTMAPNLKPLLQIPSNDDEMDQAVPDTGMMY